MIKIYHSLFFCFYNARKWNIEDKNFERSVYGMSYVMINIALTFLFVIGSFINLGLTGYGYLVGTLTAVAIYLVFKFNLKYFKNELMSNPQQFHFRKTDKNRLTALTYLILFGSFILLGFSGKHFSKNSKLHKFKQDSTVHR